MSTELIELLEACFEDDPFYRPPDAADLAEKLNRLLTPREKPAAENSSLLDALLSTASARSGGEPPLAPGRSGEARSPQRGRQRRDEVRDIWDKLGEQAPELAKLLTNGLGMKLVLVPAGSFLMGTGRDEAGARENEWPQHEITLTRPFYMAVTTITQGQYVEVLQRHQPAPAGNRNRFYREERNLNPAHFHRDNGGSDDHPVDSVTWEQAVEFCRLLSELPEEKQARRVYRLPTEAEWEYACRAGTTTPFSFGAALSSAQANFDGHFPYGGAAAGRVLQKTARVGQYPANNFGLHDMHGNVWEWCADWLDGTYYGWGPKRDPKGPGDGRYRVLRGGSWKNHAVTCRSGYRNGLNPRLKDSATGFRVVFDAP
jgi:formylglycine-generating enzyme required for sulfatase activity